MGFKRILNNELLWGKVAKSFNLLTQLCVLVIISKLFDTQIYGFFFDIIQYFILYISA